MFLNPKKKSLGKCGLSCESCLLLSFAMRERYTKLDKKKETRGKTRKERRTEESNRATRNSGKRDNEEHGVEERKKSRKQRVRTTRGRKKDERTAGHVDSSKATREEQETLEPSRERHAEAARRAGGDETCIYTRERWWRCGKEAD